MTTSRTWTVRLLGLAAGATIALAATASPAHAGYTYTEPPCRIVFADADNAVGPVYPGEVDYQPLGDLGVWIQGEEVLAWSTYEDSIGWNTPTCALTQGAYRDDIAPWW